MSTTPKRSVWTVRLASIDLVLPVCADDGPPRKTREPRRIGVTKMVRHMIPPPRYDRPVIFSSEPLLPVEPGFQHNGPCKLETRQRAANVLKQPPRQQSKRAFGCCHSTPRLPVPRKHPRHRRMLMQVLQRYSKSLQQYPRVHVLQNTFPVVGCKLRQRMRCPGNLFTTQPFLEY